MVKFLAISNKKLSLETDPTRAVQRSALCRSRRELSNAYFQNFLAKFRFDTAENEASKVCPRSRAPTLPCSPCSRSARRPRCPAPRGSALRRAPASPRCARAQRPPLQRAPRPPPSPQARAASTLLPARRPACARGPPRRPLLCVVALLARWLLA